MHKYTLFLRYNNISHRWSASHSHAQIDIMHTIQTLDSVVVSMLDCRSRGREFKSLLGQKFGSRFLLCVRLLANSTIMSTLTIHRWWEDEMTRERTGEVNISYLGLAYGTALLLLL